MSNNRGVGGKPAPHARAFSLEDSIERLAALTDPLAARKRGPMEMGDTLDRTEQVTQKASNSAIDFIMDHGQTERSAAATLNSADTERHHQAMVRAGMVADSLDSMSALRKLHVSAERERQITLSVHQDDMRRAKERMMNMCISQDEERKEWFEELTKANEQLQRALDAARIAEDDKEETRRHFEEMVVPQLQAEIFDLKTKVSTGEAIDCKLKADRNAALDYAEWADNERKQSTIRAEAAMIEAKEKTQATLTFPGNNSIFSTSTI